jgi:hypothetical protein
MPRIPYASTTQARVSPPASGASRVWSKVVLSTPLLFCLYLDALEGRLDNRKWDASAIADVHVWLLVFEDDLTLTFESEVGLQQQLDAL